MSLFSSYYYCFWKAGYGKIAKCYFCHISFSDEPLFCLTLKTPDPYSKAWLSDIIQIECLLKYNKSSIIFAPWPNSGSMRSIRGMYLIKEYINYICNHSALEATTRQTAVNAKCKNCEFALFF